MRAASWRSGSPTSSDRIGSSPRKACGRQKWPVKASSRRHACPMTLTRPTALDALDRAAYRAAGPTLLAAPVIATRMAAGRDNFTVVRLLAATLVLYGHCWALADVGERRDPISELTGVFSATLAVDVFFFVSGFLVTMSYVRRSS